MKCGTKKAPQSVMPLGSLSGREWARRFIDDLARYTDGPVLTMGVVEPWFAAALAEAYEQGQKSVTSFSSSARVS